MCSVIWLVSSSTLSSYRVYFSAPADKQADFLAWRFLSGLLDANMSSWAQQTPVCEKTQLNLLAAAPSCVHMHPRAHKHILPADPVWGHAAAYLPVTWRGMDFGCAGRPWKTLVNISRYFGVDYLNQAPLSAGYFITSVPDAECSLCLSVQTWRKGKFYCFVLFFSERAERAEREIKRSEAGLHWQTVSVKEREE